jgi:hypothetical protein
VNIFLTPYDILRLKRALGMKSGEFLGRHTIVPFDKNLKYPVVVLRMEDNEQKTCPFVGESGCRVYADRPWACRMYPLGLASPPEGTATEGEFYFLLKEAGCRGFEEPVSRTVEGWMADQVVGEYDAAGREFKELTLHGFFRAGKDLGPHKIGMFFMACYDLDRFREFVFGSSFLDKFEVDDATREKMKDEDMELLRFGYRWLRFALFGEPAIKIRREVLEERERGGRT